MRTLRATLAIVVICGALTAAAQTVHEAPAGAPSRGRVSPQGEPGQALTVSGVVVGPDGAPVAGASLYVYQTDHEGYYGVKPASDNRNPRLKVFLRSDARGAWSFDTVKPGSYPNSKIPGAHPLRDLRAGAHGEDLRDRVRRRPVRDAGDATQSRRSRSGRSPTVR